MILDVDLAALYGVATKRLNQQVNRNAQRFPQDFMFQLTKEEAQSLRLQNETSKISPHLRSQSATSKGRGGRRYAPFAFTEHGAIMASTVLNSPAAVDASLLVVRAFVELRELLSTHHQLAEKLDQLERKLQDHDGQIIAIMDAIRELMVPLPENPAEHPFGFLARRLPQARKR